jgi:hypothetical protein
LDSRRGPNGKVLLEDTLGEHQDPQAALKALQGARALQSEVTLLRGTLGPKPAVGGRDLASKEEIIRLLSKVILFRLSLTDTDIHKTNDENNRGNP